MSGTDIIKVGVFNVLAAGVSACTLQKNEAECNKIYEAFFNVSKHYQQQLLNLKETYTIDTLLQKEPSAITAFFKKNKEIHLPVKRDIQAIVDSNFKDLKSQFSEFNEKFERAYDKINSKEEGKKNLGAFLKEISNYLDIALFGGFLLGNGETVRETDGKTVGQLPLEIMTNPKFQEAYFETKKKFIKREIEDFFRGSQNSILVCPEYDYGDNIKLTGNIGVEGVGNYVSKPGEITKTSGLVKKFNAAGNFFRKVFYNNTVFQVKNITSTERFKDITLETFNNNKARIDILNFTRTSDYSSFYLISVHLDSTTDMKDYSKKVIELELILKICQEIKKTEKTVDIIVAGDFNFPLINKEDEIIEGFNGGKKVGKPKLWLDFIKIFGLTSDVGVCLKERFTKTLGNDQLWEGKGDKRAYNTDFVGKLNNGFDLSYYVDNLNFISNPSVQNLLALESDKITLNDAREATDRTEKKYYPKVILRKPAGVHPSKRTKVFMLEGSSPEPRMIDIDKSWLSDHSLVFAIIPLSSTKPGFSGGRLRITKSLHKKLRKKSSNKKRNNKNRKNTHRRKRGMKRKYRTQKK